MILYIVPGRPKAILHGLIDVSNLGQVLLRWNKWRGRQERKTISFVRNDALLIYFKPWRMQDVARSRWRALLRQQRWNYTPAQLGIKMKDETVDNCRKFLPGRLCHGNVYYIKYLLILVFLSLERSERTIHVSTLNPEDLADSQLVCFVLLQATYTKHIQPSIFNNTQY